MQFPFDNSYVHLPESLFTRVAPTPVAAPRLIAFNRPLAKSLGLADPGDERELAEIFSGNRLPPGAEPLAMAYAGHQFGHFVPLLGDGRAILVGEVRDEAGQRYDIQLKGAGLTPYSRRGDGRAALGPVLREYLVSEAFAALQIPTTRALAGSCQEARVTRKGCCLGGWFFMAKRTPPSIWRSLKLSEAPLKRAVNRSLSRSRPGSWSR